MLRPDRKPHIAQSLELFADRAFVQLYAEYLLNAPLQIGAPPPHYAVFVIIRTFLDKSGEFGFLRCGQPAGPSWCFAVFKPRQTFCIIAMHPVAQRLAVHPAGFGRSLAVFALKNQRVASIRRAAFASRAFADAARNSLAVKSLRVISIAAIAASFAPMAVSQSFTDSGILLPSQKLGRLVFYIETSPSDFDSRG